jgi:hypothetical protein
VNKKLLTLINTHYKRFYRSAIVNAITTGFVCFTVKRVDGVAMPECLPLGSFEWTISFGQSLKKSMREKQGLVAYEVQHSIGLVGTSALYISLRGPGMCSTGTSTSYPDVWTHDKVPRYAECGGGIHPRKFVELQ